MQTLVNIRRIKDIFSGDEAEDLRSSCYRLDIQRRLWHCLSSDPSDTWPWHDLCHQLNTLQHDSVEIAFNFYPEEVFILQLRFRLKGVTNLRKYLKFWPHEAEIWHTQNWDGNLITKFDAHPAHTFIQYLDDQNNSFKFLTEVAEILHGSPSGSAFPN